MRNKKDLIGAAIYLGLFVLFVWIGPACWRYWRAQWNLAETTEQHEAMIGEVLQLQAEFTARLAETDRLEKEMEFLKGLNRELLRSVLVISNEFWLRTGRTE